MTEDAAAVLALIPDRMRPRMDQLESAVAGHVTRCREIASFSQQLGEYTHAVVLLPSTLLSEDWWSVWGIINTLEKRPSILIYTLRSDFPTWSGILEAGGFDVIVAPFTRRKLQEAISAAVNDFDSRMKS